MSDPEIIYELNPSLSNDELNALFAASWADHRTSDFQPILHQSLLFVGAYLEARLIGFVNVAWDGGIHAFILDTTVHPDVRRKGVGVALVQKAAEAARSRGIEWLHVDYEPHLKHFYEQCGFHHTEAGLMRLNPIS